MQCIYQRVEDAHIFWIAREASYNGQTLSSVITLEMS